MPHALPEDYAAHRDRARAESFGAAAEDYDRYRPSYPRALVDDLADLALSLHAEGRHAGRGRGPRVLDIGCGTGKLAVLLRDRGLDVLGVEVDPAMARVAADHGVPVEVAPLEDWDDAGRRFAMITCGQAWHWLDPVRALPKVAGLLEPGGTLALVWNYGDLEPGLDAVAQQVHQELVPGWEGSTVVGFARDDAAQLQPLRDSGRFAVAGAHTYEWWHEYTPADWVAMLQTHSNHLRLPTATRDELGRRLVAALTAATPPRGLLTVRYATLALLARTPLDPSPTPRGDA